MSISNGFVGRAAEVQAFVDLLAGGRPVAVMGTAGIGKSRLVAEALRGRDVRWVSMGDGEVVEVVAGQVLVLDGCDGWAREAHAAARIALDRGARVVATSRDVLGLPGEQLLALAPLAGSPGDDAVALLQQRGAAGLAAEECGLLARALLGLPLALELAAARVADRGVEAVRRTLLAAIDELQRSGGRVVRATVIEMAVDWALEALDASERAALRRVACLGQATDATRATLSRRGVLRPHPWAPDRLHVPALVRERLLLGEPCGA